MQVSKLCVIYEICFLQCKALHVGQPSFQKSVQKLEGRCTHHTGCQEGAPVVGVEDANEGQSKDGYCHG